MTTELIFLHNMMCLVPDTPEERFHLGKDALPVRTRDGDMLFDRARIEIVRGYSGERVYNAAVRTLGLLRQDLPHLSIRGFTTDWLRDFTANKDAFYEQTSEELAEREAGAATRLFSVATGLPGAEVARRVLVLSQGHWVQELLGVNLSSLQTIEGLHAGLRQMNGRLRNPLVEERVLQTGITKDELEQMSEAQAALHRMIDEARMAEAAAAGGPAPLLVARAVLWAEMTLVGAAARAELPEERWRLYQAPALLELAPRGPDRRDPPAPEPDVPAPQPTTGTLPGQPGAAPPTVGTLPGTSAPTAGPAGTTAGAAPAVTPPAEAGPAGAPPAGASTAPPGATSSGTAPATPTIPPGTAPAPRISTPTAPGTAPPPPGAAPAGTPAGRPAVPPGTPLYAVPPGGGQPVPVVLLPDGTLAWGAPPAAARKDAPAPAAPRKPAPRKSRR